MSRKPSTRVPEPPKPVFVSQMAAAGHLFMTPLTFKSLQDRGIIKKPVGKGYLLDEVREQYIRHIRAVASGHVKPENGLDGAAEKARKDKEMADRVALQNAVTRGELAEVSEFERLLTDGLLRCRAKLLAGPAKLAPRLEGLNRNEIKEEIVAYLEDALDEIKNTRFEPNLPEFVHEHELPDDNEA